MPERVSVDFDIIRKDAAHQLVYGVVMEPNEVDAHQDFTEEEEIFKANLSFMKKSWNPIGLQHKAVGYGVKIIENYIAPVDFQMGEEKVLKGSWVMGVYCPDEIWTQVEKGDFTGFSIGGTGLRIPVEAE